MAPPRRGHFVLHSNVLPPVTAGGYELTTEQTGTPFAVEPERTHVRVSAPRFTMPPEQILSTFPPANGEGAFGDRLPQVVLRRRTLPWERNPAGGSTVSPTPWLALVVVAEGEAELSAPTAVERCVTPGVALSDPGDRDVAEGVHLTVTETVVGKLFPTQEDLPLLVHVREVDVQDTELAGGDDDGWSAVVLANRLPVFDSAAEKPVRYLACLVNLEGQLDALPPPSPPVEVFEYVLAQDWSSLATLAPQADAFAAGTGIAGLPVTRGLLDGPVAGAPATFERLPEIGAELDGTATLASFETAARWSEGPSAAVAEAALDADAARRVRDTMGIGFHLPIEAFAVERTLRFPVLAHWSFTTNEGATFETLMQDLDVGLLGSVSTPPPSAAPPAPAGAEVVETGHVGLDHTTRRGDATRAWYRGPLVPHPTGRDAPDGDGRLPVAHAADQLRRVVPDGREDLALAAGYEIGRLLALSQLSIVSTLLRFRREQFGAARIREVVDAIVPGTLFGVEGFRDLSHLVGQGLLETLAVDPLAFAGPGRPVADPGRPLELDGGLDAVVAAGLGLDLAALEEAAQTAGIVAALAATSVPLVDFGSEPLRTGPELDAMGTALHAEIGRLAAVAAPTQVHRDARRRGPAAERPADDGDPLDALIARAPTDDPEVED